MEPDRVRLEPQEADRRGVAQDEAAPPPATVPAHLLRLQRQAGNQAVAGLVARQPTPGLVAPPSAEGLSRHLEPVLTAAPTMESDVELADALAEAAVDAIGRGLDDATKEQVRLRGYEVLGRSQSVGDITYNLHSALKALRGAVSSRRTFARSSRCRRASGGRCCAPETSGSLTSRYGSGSLVVAFVRGSSLGTRPGRRGS
jgi:hypothetical protein